MLRFPPPLRPGDVVRVVAPSSPFPRDELLAGLAWLGARYRLRADASLFAREGYLAGSDEARAASLTRALEDADARAIVCARGGYGATRIVDSVPWDLLASAPKWIVGFSDVTALHAAASSVAGVASVHGPNATGLARDLSPRDRAALLACLEGRGAAMWSELRVVRGGDASGPAFGGNLAVLAALAGSRYLKPPRGAVLLLEDVTERPYRIDRMLTTLRLCGALEGLSAIVCGELTRCEPGPDGITAEEVLARSLAPLGIPVVLGAPFGHGAANASFVVGARARVWGDRVEIG